MMQRSAASQRDADARTKEALRLNEAFMSRPNHLVDHWSLPTFKRSASSSTKDSSSLASSTSSSCSTASVRGASVGKLDSSAPSSRENHRQMGFIQKTERSVASATKKAGKVQLKVVETSAATRSGASQGNGRKDSDSDIEEVKTIRKTTIHTTAATLEAPPSMVPKGKKRKKMTEYDDDFAHVDDHAASSSSQAFHVDAYLFSSQEGGGVKQGPTPITATGTAPIASSSNPPTSSARITQSKAVSSKTKSKHTTTTLLGASDTSSAGGDDIEDVDPPPSSQSHANRGLQGTGKGKGSSSTDKFGSEVEDLPEVDEQQSTVKKAKAKRKRTPSLDGHPSLTSSLKRERTISEVDSNTPRQRPLTSSQIMSQALGKGRDVTKPSSPRKARAKARVRGRDSSQGSDSTSEDEITIPGSSSAHKSASTRPRAKPSVRLSQSSAARSIVRPTSIQPATTPLQLGYDPPVSSAADTVRRRARPIARPKTGKTSSVVSSSTPVAEVQQNPAPRRRARPTRGAQRATEEEQASEAGLGSTAKRKKVSHVHGDEGVEDGSASSVDLSSSPDPVGSVLTASRRGRRQKEDNGSGVEEEDEEDDPFLGGNTQIWFRNAQHGDVDSEPSQEELDDDDARDSGDESVRLDAFGNVIDGEVARCPFCDGPLPREPTVQLIDMLVKLCSSTELDIRSGSDHPHALRLPITATIAACKRHREETDIIPQGIRAGYPKAEDVDWKALPNRISRLCAKELGAIAREPAKSPYFELARREWEATGARRMGNVLSEWGSFDQELPGYYGSKGFVIMMAWVKENLIEDDFISPRKVDPLDVPMFARRVMVPEIALRLIQADQDEAQGGSGGLCSRKRAASILQASRAYGGAVFGHQGPDGLDEDAKESEREQRRAAKEERRRRKEAEAIISSSQGTERAEALQRGQQAILYLRSLVTAS